eukprot:54180_1
MTTVFSLFFILSIPAVVILSVPATVHNLRWICTEYSNLNRRQLHLIPATIAMILYMVATAFVLTQNFSAAFFYQNACIYVWASAEIAVHLFFIIHIYEEFHDELVEDDELNLKLQPREKKIMVILMTIFYISQLYMGANAILFHNEVIDHVTAQWSDLWMAVISLISNTSICIYLLKVYGVRLKKTKMKQGDINNYNVAFATLVKYYLLLGAATVDSAIQITLQIVSDAMNVHNDSQDQIIVHKGIQLLSNYDQITYAFWIFDISLNIYLLYLNIEPGERLYNWCCVESKCEKCVKSRFVDDGVDLLLNQ